MSDFNKFVVERDVADDETEMYSDDDDGIKSTSVCIVFMDSIFHEFMFDIRSNPPVREFQRKLRKELIVFAMHYVRKYCGKIFLFKHKNVFRSAFSDATHQFPLEWLILKYPRNQRLLLNFLNAFIGPYRVPDTCVPIDNITTKL